MKRKIALFLGLLTIALPSIGAMTASADSHPSLQGADAQALAQVIRTGANVTDNGNSVGIVSVICEAYGYAIDTCVLYKQLQDPAAHATEIEGGDASILWHYLHQAGFPNFVSDIADGTAGHVMLSAGAIQCTLGNSTCTFADQQAQQ